MTLERGKFVNFLEVSRQTAKNRALLIQQINDGDVFGSGISAYRDGFLAIRYYFRKAQYDGVRGDPEIINDMLLLCGSLFAPLYFPVYGMTEAGYNRVRNGLKNR